MKHLRGGLTALAMAVALVGCGGGGAESTPRSGISSVKVFGDSLADSGTYGIKMTVQAPGAQVFTERVAANYGVALCPALTYTGGTFAPNAGCTNYAVAGSRINVPGAAAGDPRVVGNQMAIASSAGAYAASDLVLIDGGGNDAADLIGAYLNASKDAGAAFNALVGSLVPQATIQATVLAAAGTTQAEKYAAAMPTLGGAYMQALASTFYGQIRTHVLDKGATSVALLNMPAITNTPRFKMVLGGIQAARGEAAATAAATLFDGWIQAFNSTLSAAIDGNSSVVPVDFYQSFVDQVATPEQFRITNVDTPACPIVGQEDSGLPKYDFATCTADALSAQTTLPPLSNTTPVPSADWWTHYAFADGFHPTPYTHALLGQRVALDLAKAGRF